MEGAKYLFTNEYEWGLLQQKTGLSAERLTSMVQVRVTTLGERGADIVVTGPDGAETDGSTWTWCPTVAGWTRPAWATASARASWWGSSPGSRWSAPRSWAPTWP